MIEEFKSRYRLEEGIFDTIFGIFEGHRNKIYASRKMAEKIEIQIRYTELPKAYYQGFRYIGINYFVRGL